MRKRDYAISFALLLVATPFLVFGFFLCATIMSIISP